MNLFDNQNQASFIYRVSILEMMSTYSQKDGKLCITIETRTATTETAARKILQQLSKKYNFRTPSNH